jgi:competence protein ComEC
MLLFLTILEVALFASIDTRFHLYFLDVGQGDSILIKTPGYHYILVDGGENEEILEEISEVMPFWKRNIDIVICTHAHADHIGGLVYILENYTVGEYLSSDLDAGDSLSRKVKDLLKQKNIRNSELVQGNRIKIGELNIEVLWPEAGFVSENENEMSIMLYGEFTDFSFMLTGDAEKGQEEALVSNYNDLDSIILKAGHHGSKTSNTDEFLELVSPDYFVISCGSDNKFGHPNSEVIDRVEEKGIEIMRTDWNGRIEFITDGKVITKKLEK